MTRRERRKLIATAIYKNSDIFKREDRNVNILIGFMLIMSVIGCISTSYWLNRFIISLF